MDLLEICRKAIEIDSSPRSGTEDLAEYFAKVGVGLGLTTKTDACEVDGIRQANVILKLGAEDGAPLVLQSHLDTLEPGLFGQWTETYSNPYAATQKGEMLYGLGAAESKADFVAKIMAASQFAQKKLNRPLWVVGTFGKESGSLGVKKWIETLKIKPALVLVSSPTGSKITTRCNGYASIEARLSFTEEELQAAQQTREDEITSTQSRIFRSKVAFRTGHQTSECAVAKLFDYIQRIPSSVAIVNIEAGTSPWYSATEASVEVNMNGGVKNGAITKLQEIIRILAEVEALSGSSYRVLPGKIRSNMAGVTFQFVLDLSKFLDQKTWDKLVDFVKSSSEKIGVDIRIREVQLYNKLDKKIDEYQKLKSVADACGVEEDSSAFVQTDEALLLRAKGITAVSFGPGVNDSQSSSYNESVNIEKLKAAQQFYEQLIGSFCL